MAETVRGLHLKITGDASGLKGTLAEVSKDAGTLSKKLGNIEGVLNDIGGSLTRGLTVPIVAGFTAAIKTTADYEQSLQKTKAVMQDLTDTEAVALDRTIRDLAQSTKYTATETADAAYYMGMAGWTYQDVSAGLASVLNLATASGEDLATTSDIVTDSLTAFGLGAEDASHFADVLAQTSVNANTNVSLMGETFKYAAPLAGALGYSIEDIALATGLMANNGIKGSMAGTSLRNIFQRLSAPTKESAEAMEALGISLMDADGNAYSFRKIMNDLRQSMRKTISPTSDAWQSIANLNSQLEDGSLSEEQYTEALSKVIEASDGVTAAEQVRYAAMLAGARGMPALLAVINSSEEDYNNLAAAIDGCDNVAQKMATTMNDTLGGQFTILMSQLQELAIQVGELLMPKLREIVSWAQEMVTKLQELDPATKERIIQIAEIAALVGPFLLTLGKVVGTIRKLSKAVMLLSSPIGLIIIGIGLFAGAILYLWQTNEDFRNDVTAMWEDLKQDISESASSIKESLNLIVDALNSCGFEFESFGDVVKTAWDAVVNKIAAPKLKNAIFSIKQTISSVAAIISGLFAILIKLINGDYIGAIKEAEKMTGTLVGNIKETYERKFNQIWDIVSPIVEKLKNAFNFSWKLPSITNLPKISITRGASGLPHISISKYAKAYDTPYLFTRPTLMGNKMFGDGGGSGEIVYGRDQLLRDIATASQGEVTINVYASDGMNVNQLADKVQQRLVQLQRQRMSAYA